MSSFGRALAVLRTGTLLLRRGQGRILIRNFRASDVQHSEARYRLFPEVTKKQKFDSEFLSSAMWFWILWNSWHNPDAVLGHFPWPDTSQWTDEELGIPPDEE